MAEEPPGRIWIDGDACPRVIRERVERQALRRGRPVVLVTNQPRPAHMPDFVAHVRVPDHPDAADDYIADRVQCGDVVVTDDTPLAARVVAAGGWAVTTRGKIMSEANAQDRLATRDLLSGLRDQGMPISGPSPLSDADLQRFAQALSQLLDKRVLR